MKALTFENYGKSPEIAITHVPIPAIKPDELLVEVHAAGLNPIDNIITTGVFKSVVKLQLPATMGSDLAGVVIQVGSAVTDSRQATRYSRACSNWVGAPSPSSPPYRNTLPH